MSLQQGELQKNTVIAQAHENNDISALIQLTARNTHDSSQRGVHNFEEHKL